MKKSIISLVIAITMFSCTTQKEFAVMNIYPDYENQTVSVDIIRSKDTLQYYDMDKEEFRELLAHNQKYSLMLSYK